MAHTCGCVASHRPAVMVIEKHHILPLSWGGADAPDNWLYVCPTSHYNIHSALNVLVHAGHVPTNATDPSYQEWVSYPVFARKYAQQAWNEHDPSKPTPITLHSHEGVHNEEDKVE